MSGGDSRPGPVVVEEQPSRAAPAHAWWSLLAVALGIMVVQLDGTVVSVANPAIAADLGAGPQGIQWVTTAYLLVFAGLLVPAGTVADRIGRRRAFLVGVAGFSLASMLCGLAGSVEWLVAARVAQAIFAALIGPAGLALVRTAFPPSVLPRALGVFGAVSAAALAGGPIIGGLLVESAGWPAVFLVNLPVGALGVVVGALVLRESGRDGERARVDVAGAVALTAAMLAVVWGISTAQGAGWLSPLTLGALGVGLVSLGAFVVIERRVDDPVVPLSLFATRSFSVGCVLTTVTMLAFFAILFYLTFFLQGVQGRGAVATGVALLPLTAVFTVAAPLAGWATSALGERVTLVLGAAVTAGALLLLGGAAVDTTIVELVPALLLAGLGAALLLVPAIGVVVGNAPEERAGVASGIQQSAQQLGGTLGVAVFGGVLASVVAGRLPAAIGAAGDDPVLRRLGADPEVRQAVALGFDPAAQASLAERLVEAGTAPDRVPGLVRALTSAGHATFVAGLHTVFAVAAVLTVAAGLLALLVRSGQR